MSDHELQQILSATVELTKLRLQTVPHLCIENFAPEVFGRLLQRYQSAIYPATDTRTFDEPTV